MSMAALRRRRFVQAAAEEGGGEDPGDGGGGFYYFNDFSSGALTPASTGSPEGGVWTPTGFFSWQPGMDGVVDDFPPGPSGKKALAFHFTGTPGPSGDESKEQQITFGQPIGGAGQSIFMRWKQFVSENFASRDPGQPTKWFQLWNGRYTYSTTFGFTMRSEADGGTILQPFITGKGPNGTTPPYWTGNYQAGPQTWANSGRLMYPLGSPTPGILIPGQEHDIKVRLQFSTSLEAEDGTLDVWVDDVLFLHAGPCSIYTGADDRDEEPKLNGGYLMGYSNSGYDEPTSFYFTDLEITTVDPEWGL